MPECSDCTCMLVCASFHHCTRDRGCSKHPAFPAPSVLEGGKFFDKLAQMMRRGREVTFNCHHPRTRVIQYSRDGSDRIEKPRRSGYPACAGCDGCGYGDALGHGQKDLADATAQLKAVPAVPPRSYRRCRWCRLQLPRHRCRSRRGRAGAAAPAGWRGRVRRYPDRH